MAQQKIILCVLLGALFVGSLVDSKSDPPEVVFGAPEQVHISFGGKT